MKQGVGEAWWAADPGGERGSAIYVLDGQREVPCRLRCGKNTSWTAIFGRYVPFVSHRMQLVFSQLLSSTVDIVITTRHRQFFQSSFIRDLIAALLCSGDINGGNFVAFLLTLTAARLTGSVNATTLHRTEKEKMAKNWTRCESNPRLSQSTITLPADGVSRLVRAQGLHIGNHIRPSTVPRSWCLESVLPLNYTPFGLVVRRAINGTYKGI